MDYRREVLGSHIWHSQPKFPCPVNPIFNCNCLNDLDLDMDRDLGVSAG